MIKFLFCIFGLLNASFSALAQGNQPNSKTNPIRTVPVCGDKLCEGSPTQKLNLPTRHSCFACSLGDKVRGQCVVCLDDDLSCAGECTEAVTEYTALGWTCTSCFPWWM